VDDVALPAGEVWDGRADASGRVVWADRDGTERQGTVSVPVGAEAGHTVTVWLDGDGDRTTSPMSGADVTGRAVTQGVGTYALLSALAVGVHLWVRGLLDASRSRRWAAEWADVEPEWTRTMT